MSEETRNKALLRTMTLGMILAGPLAIVGGTTAYAGNQASSATTYSQKASGEAKAEGSSYKAKGEAEGSSYGSGEAEGASYGAGEAEAPAALPLNCPPGTTPQRNGTCLLS